jgi:hypothetical protein
VKASTLICPSGEHVRGLVIKTRKKRMIVPLLIPINSSLSRSTSQSGVELSTLEGHCLNSPEYWKAVASYFFWYQTCHAAGLRRGLFLNRNFASTRFFFQSYHMFGFFCFFTTAAFAEDVQEVFEGLRFQVCESAFED